MKVIGRTIPLLVVLILGAAASAGAQTNLSAFFGVGSAYDSGTGGCASLGFPDEHGPCSNGAYPTPSMGGIFGVFGADYMFSKHLGVGGEYTFRFTQAPYTDVNYRPEFYDFNALYHPFSNRRAVFEVQGGVGGFDTKFYLPSECNTDCSVLPAYLNTPDHFQVHAAVDVKLYVHGGIFIKPEFDIHYVVHLSGALNSTDAPTEQFGTDWVPEGTVSIGYTFGER